MRNSKCFKMKYDIDGTGLDCYTVADDPSFTVKPSSNPKVGDELKKKRQNDEKDVTILEIWEGKIVRLHFNDKESNEDIWIKSNDPKL